MKIPNFLPGYPIMTSHITKVVFYDVNRGYSILFDEYEIHFTSETGFLIFSRVRSTSENIITILSHE
jgi:hypothetical protein